MRDIIAAGVDILFFMWISSFYLQVLLLLKECGRRRSLDNQSSEFLRSTPLSSSQHLFLDMQVWYAFFFTLDHKIGMEEKWYDCIIMNIMNIYDTCPNLYHIWYDMDCCKFIIDLTFPVIFFFHFLCNSWFSVWKLWMTKL